MRYQQNLTGRKIAFVVIGNQQWPTLRRYVDRVVAAVNAATPGSYVEVEIPSLAPCFPQSASSRDGSEVMMQSVGY
jgi:hypothetical protein